MPQSVPLSSSVPATRFGAALNPVGGDAAFMETMGADAWALFLDIDGTLAPFAETPDDAFIPLPTLKTLGALHAQLNGALALVSGRSLRDIDRMSGPHRFTAAALHGIEIRLPDGEIEAPAEGSALLDQARAMMGELATREPELFIEDKGFSLAVHYRRKPELETGVLDALRTLQTMHAAKLYLLEGKMVGELRLRGGDKGTAIERLLKNPPFQGRRPFFAGDDRTDEDAFRAVAALGGYGIKIGDGESAAQARLPSPAAFAAWLSALTAHFAHASSTDFQRTESP